MVCTFHFRHSFGFSYFLHRLMPTTLSIFTSTHSLALTRLLMKHSNPVKSSLITLSNYLCASGGASMRKHGDKGEIRHLTKKQEKLSTCMTKNVIKLYFISSYSYKQILITVINESIRGIRINENERALNKNNEHHLNRGD